MHFVIKIAFKVSLNQKHKFQNFNLLELLIILRILLKQRVFEGLFHVKALKDLLFVSNQLTQYLSCLVFLLSLINLTWKVNIFNTFKWKIFFNSLRNCKDT